MRIIENVLESTEIFPDLVLTIGSFDGVHLGHQRILSRLLDEARQRKGTAALMTLRPHPRQYFAPGNAPNLLTDDRQKERLLAESGLDVLYILPFTQATAGMSAKLFLERVIIGCCKAHKLIIGHDFAFGKGAEGNYEFLQSHAGLYGLELEQIPALYVQGERVSSTLIRERILQGEVEDIDLFLGRHYSITGTVMRGRGIGRQLGFPTANLRIEGGASPAHGVYAAEAVTDGKRFQAAVNIGIAPTIRHDDAVIEAHLLDYDGDLNDQEIEVVFRKHLRSEKKFNSREELMAAIAADIHDVRAYFTGKPGTSGKV